MKILKLAQIDNTYRQTVKLFVFCDNEKYDVNPALNQIEIPFEIQMEHRSWGIKDIGIVLSGALNVGIVVSLMDETIATRPYEEQKTITVDLSKIRKETNTGRGGLITLGDLTIHLNNDFSVDYKYSSIDIYGAGE